MCLPPQDNPIEDVVFATFSVESDRFGEKIVADLVPNGRHIVVDDKNKVCFTR